MGKSVALTMLGEYLEPRRDPTIDNFKRLAIEQASCVHRFRYRHPVLQLHFSPLERVRTEHEFLAALRGMVNKHFLHRWYLVNDMPRDRKRYERILFDEREDQHDAVAFDFKWLMQLLATHHKADVVVLIDDYDTALAAAQRVGTRASYALGNLLGSAIKGSAHGRRLLA